MRVFRWIFWAALVLGTLSASVQNLVPDRAGGNLGAVAVFALWGLVLGSLTFRVHRSSIRAPFRKLLVLLLAYHACFGPVMLLYIASTEAQRNDDLPLVLYPHVVHWINALE